MIFRTSLLALLIIISVAGCMNDPSGTVIQSCDSMLTLPTSLISADVQLSDGNSHVIFGQGVSSSGYKAINILISDKDSCSLHAASITLSDGYTDGRGHYAEVQVGSIVTLGGSDWIVTEISYDEFDKLKNGIALRLVPDTKFPVPFDTLSTFSEMVILPGGKGTSVFELDGAAIGIFPVDPELMKTGADLEQILIHDPTCPAGKFRPVTVGSEISTPRFKWEILKIYFVNVTGINYTRILVGRK